MRKGDVQYAYPNTLFVAAKVAIEALTGVPTGSEAYANDNPTAPYGTFNGLTWDWQPLVGGISDAASDGFAYGRKDAAWAKVGGLALANTWTANQKIQSTGVATLTLEHSGGTASNPYQTTAIDFNAGAWIRQSVAYTTASNYISFSIIKSGVETNYLTANYLGNIRLGGTGLDVGIVGPTYIWANALGISDTRAAGLHIVHTGIGGALSGATMKIQSVSLGGPDYPESIILESKQGAGVQNTNQLYLSWSGFVGVGIYPLAKSHIYDTTTTANAIKEIQRIEAAVSTAATGGSDLFGACTNFAAESATDGTSKLLAMFAGQFKTAAAATFLGKAVIGAYDYNSPTTPRIGLEIEGDGSAVRIGFLGATPVVQQLAATDLGVVLSNLGLRVAGTAYPITTSGAVTISDVNYTSSTPAALSGDVNDWDLGNVTFVRANGGAADRIITGIVARADGHLLKIHNIGTTNKLSFSNQSGSSSAANRLINANAGTTEILPNHAIQYIYDATTARWREETHL
jgi:hypothetical protein